MIEKAEKVLGYDVVAAQVFEGNTADFVSCVGFCHFDGEGVHFGVCNPPRKRHKHKIIQIFLTIIGNLLHVLETWLHQINHW